MKSIALDITGMSCDHCVGQVRTAVEALSGVASCVVSINRATVTFDHHRCSAGDIVAAVGRSGAFQVQAFGSVEPA